MQGSSRWWLYARLVRLDKPVGIWLLLWPTLWGLWFAAHGFPGWSLLAIFTLGTVLMRSAGCAINDWADRDFDRHVARTRHRVLTAGLIDAREALGVAAVLTVCAALLILPLGTKVWELAAIAVLTAATYPFFKRFFAIPQAYLGIAFSMGIPMAYAAQEQNLDSTTYLLIIANIAWAIAYDTIYAMVDRDDDRRLGLRTAALTFGRSDILCIGLCFLICLTCLIIAGVNENYGATFAVGITVAALAAIRTLWGIRNRLPNDCLRHFQQSHWFGAAVFAGLVMSDLLKA